jgi:MoxR-like ATPase
LHRSTYLIETMSKPLPIARTGSTELCLLSSLANRHGLITGATGTGKTVTLQRMAEQFFVLGVSFYQL